MHNQACVVTLWSALPSQDSYPLDPVLLESKQQEQRKQTHDVSRDAKVSLVLCFPSEESVL